LGLLSEVDFNSKEWQLALVLLSRINTGGGEWQLALIGLAQRNELQQRRVATRIGIAQRNEYRQRRVATRMVHVRLPRPAGTERKVRTSGKRKKMQQMLWLQFKIRVRNAAGLGRCRPFG
jgi:hypothetical protein